MYLYLCVLLHWCWYYYELRFNASMFQDLLRSGVRECAFVFIKFFNWMHCFFSMIFRSDFARLNFYGFYSVVLEKDDVLISVASIR
jgi:hypothetical protein